MEEVLIRTEFIKLQQAIKLAGIVGQGSDAKLLIQNGAVKVNGVVATERGKKIHHNDIVTVQETKEFKIIVKNTGK